MGVDVTSHCGIVFLGFFVKSYQKVAEAAVQVVFQQKQDIFFEFTMQYEATACVYGGNMCVCLCVCLHSLPVSRVLLCVC